MRIQHNIAALNAHRQLTNNNNSVAKNLEKLSSGYKINRAGDDAAGLAISEKMRAQITGLETAQKNANDGISLVQTAEGALTEVHSMLNRMVELAEQSANGTYEDTVDRNNLQKELNSLRTEIDRIAEGTNFNGINLLDGSLGSGASAAEAVTITGTVNGTELKGTEVKANAQVYEIAAPSGMGDENVDAKLTYTVDGKEKDITSTATIASSDSAEVAAGKLVAAFKTSMGDDADLFTFEADSSGKITITSKTEGTANTIKSFEFDPESKGPTTSWGSGKEKTEAKDAATTYDLSGWKKDDTITVGGKEYTQADHADLPALKKALDADGYTLNTDNNAAVTITAKADASVSGGLTLQIGDTADAFNKLSVSVNSMKSDALGIGSIDIGTQDGASDAIKKIKDAINTVSSTRGDLGAIQNRLEHTINNLSVTTENMTAAESRIRDVDMAQEMMEFTKNNILTQASQSMLAQANQLPQGVLQLLQ